MATPSSVITRFARIRCPSGREISEVAKSSEVNRVFSLSSEAPAAPSQNGGENAITIDRRKRKLNFFFLSQISRNSRQFGGRRRKGRQRGELSRRRFISRFLHEENPEVTQYRPPTPGKGRRARRLGARAAAAWAGRAPPATPAPPTHAPANPLWTRAGVATPPPDRRRRHPRPATIGTRMLWSCFAPSFLPFHR